jgi:hypothetical protein
LQVRILDFNPTEAVNFEAEIQAAEAEDITQASAREELTTMSQSVGLLQS